jgi:hypothetical protein
VYGGLIRFVTKPGEREELRTSTRFGQVMDELVEGWTMIVPFGNSVASNQDGQ